METKFREISELMDDSNDKMPEGTYLALYNKLKELRDESNKNTDAEHNAMPDSDDDDYEDPHPNPTYERLRLELHWMTEGNRVCHEQWQKWKKEAEDLEKEGEEYELENKELKDKIKELEEATLRSRPRCRCGSTTHRNPNALVCRLNKRVLAGELGTAARDRALGETADHWRDALTVGTVIDAQDSDNKWFDAVITNVDGDLLGVHYRGWRAKWDEKNVPRSSERIQPLHTHTPRWREFTLGDQVEVHLFSHSTGGHGWYRGSVTAVNPHPWRRVKITPMSHLPQYTVHGRHTWVEFDSEKLCRPGTHISRREFATLV